MTGLAWSSSQEHSDKLSADCRDDYGDGDDNPIYSQSRTSKMRVKSPEVRYDLYGYLFLRISRANTEKPMKYSFLFPVENMPYNRPILPNSGGIALV